jgi:hypothetical protein
MIALLVAAALAPWTQPLAFRLLAGWHTGTSGTVASLYDNATARVPVPKESAAWIATRDVRYLDSATEDPPDRTLSHLPRKAVVVWAVIFQTDRPRQKPIRLGLRYARHFACCEGSRLAAGSYELVGAGPGHAYSVIVRIYFGSRPTQALRVQAQEALDRLRLPSPR